MSGRCNAPSPSGGKRKIQDVRKSRTDPARKTNWLSYVQEAKGLSSIRTKQTGRPKLLIHQALIFKPLNSFIRLHQQIPRQPGNRTPRRLIFRTSRSETIETKRESYLESWRSRSRVAHPSLNWKLGRRFGANGAAVRKSKLLHGAFEVDIGGAVLQVIRSNEFSRQNRLSRLASLRMRRVICLEEK